MAGIYSALLINQGDIYGAGSGLVNLEPGYVYVVVDVFAFCTNYDPSQEPAGLIVALSNFTNVCNFQEPYPTYIPTGHWTGRQVLDGTTGSPQIAFYRTDDYSAWQCAVSGFQLTP